MVRTLGYIWGAIFLLGGVLGFVPWIAPGGRFFGLFVVNTPHGLVHLVSGAIFLLASWIGPAAARWWFRIFGLAYAAMAVLGFQVGAGMICGVIANNRVDSWGHAGLALILLVIGFAAHP